MASRLIAINKNPGVIPIGVCESVGRIVGKAILRVVGSDILDAVGVSQLCAGQDGGCEAVVHAAHQLFESADCEVVLFVDASNAFNLLNYQAALRNAFNLCPSLGSVVINCYYEKVPLFIDGEVIFSSEGTTQGDPLSMALYAIATLPLVCQLDHYSCAQIWYADDAAADGELFSLRNWRDHICLLGSAFGYFSNGAKSCLVVESHHASDATSTLPKLGST